MASTIKTVPIQKWLALGVLLALVLIVGAAGSVVTMPKIPAWYAGINKPFFSPPNWVFCPVWTLLYVMMAVAAWRIWLGRKSKIAGSSVGVVRGPTRTQCVLVAGFLRLRGPARGARDYCCSSVDDRADNSAVLRA